MWKVLQMHGCLSLKGGCPILPTPMLSAGLPARGQVRSAGSQRGLWASPLTSPPHQPRPFSSCPMGSIFKREGTLGSWLYVLRPSVLTSSTPHFQV